MSNLLEICWQHLMSWLKNKLSNLQSFKTNTVLNGDVCWLLFLSLSSGQLWKQNALKNIQPVLGKDQKQIRCQHQLMSVLQERKKQSEMSFSCHASLCVPHLHTRAPGHSTASLPADLDPRPEWDRAVHHCPTPLPKELISLYSCSTRTFLPMLLLIGLAVLEKAKKSGLTWHRTVIGFRVRAALLTLNPCSGCPHRAWLSLGVGGESPWICEQWQVMALLSFPALPTLRLILSVCICKTTQIVLG